MVANAAGAGSAAGQCHFASLMIANSAYCIRARGQFGLILCWARCCVLCGAMCGALRLLPRQVVAAAQAVAGNAAFVQLL